MLSAQQHASAAPEQLHERPRWRFAGRAGRLARGPLRRPGKPLRGAAISGSVCRARAIRAGSSARAAPGKSRHALIAFPAIARRPAPKACSRRIPTLPAQSRIAAAHFLRRGRLQAPGRDPIRRVPGSVIRRPVGGGADGSFARSARSIDPRVLFPAKTSSRRNAGFHRLEHQNRSPTGSTLVCAPALSRPDELRASAFPAMSCRECAATGRTMRAGRIRRPGR